MVLPAPEEFVRRCASLQADPAQLATLVAGRLDWERVRMVAAQQRVFPFLCEPLSGLPPSAVPSAILREARDSAAAVAARNVRNARDVSEILHAFRSRGVQGLFLKGAALLRTAYRRTPQLRSARDIDILVRHAHLSQAHQALLDLSYATEAIPGLVPIGRYLLPVYTRRHPTERVTDADPDALHITTVRKQRPPAKDEVCVELHLGLIRPDSTPFQVAIPELWNRARLIAGAGGEMLVLSPEDMILHLALHMSFHKEFVFSPLRQLRDIGEVIRSEPVDWDLLLNLADRCRATRSVYYALHLARGWLGAGVPEDSLWTLRARIGSWELALFAQLEEDAHFVTYRDPARLYLQTLLLRMCSFQGMARRRFLTRMLRHPIASNKNPAKLLLAESYTPRFRARHVALALLVMGKCATIAANVVWRIARTFRRRPPLPQIASTAVAGQSLRVEDEQGAQ